MLPSNKLAVIHIAKSQVGMTEDAYRDLLSSFKNQKGKPAKSSKELSPLQFEAIMEHFEKLGFRNKFKKKYRKPRKGVAEKVNAIRLDLGLSWAYIDDGIVKKRFKNMDGQPVERFQFLPPDDQRKVQQMLIIHQKRQHAKSRRKS